MFQRRLLAQQLTLPRNLRRQRGWNNQQCVLSSSNPRPSPSNQRDNDKTKHSTTGSQNQPLDPPNISATWVELYLPSSMQPYAQLARMDKPIGTWLLLWPCCWSTALATDPGALPDPWLLSLFGIGAFCMRGAGCTINDLWDVELDKQVARTASRPLASGTLTPTKAVAFLGLQLSAGLAVLLSLPHTYYCFKVGVASLPLVVIYPLMKRYTRVPQLVLGLTFNWGALMGWAATHGSLDNLGVILPLYASGVAWTMVYDTLYAHQDKVDDAKVGIYSTALFFGDESTKPVLHGFAFAAYTSWMMVAPTSPLSYIGLTAAYGHLVWQIHTADLNDPTSVGDRFRSNHTVGAVVFTSFVAGNFML